MICNDNTDEEFEEMYAEGEGTSYYTNWYEDSKVYESRNIQTL